MDLVADTEDADDILWLQQCDSEKDELLYDTFWQSESRNEGHTSQEADDELLFFDLDGSSSLSPSPVVLATDTAPPTQRSPSDLIESVFSAIADSMGSEGEDLSIQILTRPKSWSQSLALGRQKNQIRIISFPGKTPQDAWRFSQQHHKIKQPRWLLTRVSSLFRQSTRADA